MTKRIAPFRLALVGLLATVALSGLSVGNAPVEAAATVESPVRCNDYRAYLRPFAAGFATGPDRGQYGARHALPALALYAGTRDPRLGDGIKQTLRHYGAWIDAQIAAQGGVQSMEGATLLGIYRREFLRQGTLSRTDERWFRDTLLKLRRYSYGLKPGDGPWRGSQHRGMVEGTNNLLAASLYPDEPQAARWKVAGERVWNDWWRYRDIGINDIAYFSDSLAIMLRAADLLGRDEVFSDPQARATLWDRMVYETSPDGAVIPYGAHAGWNGLAGVRIYALELAARHTGDGRYRYVAGKLFDYARTHGGFSPGQEHWAAVSVESLALASLVCDDGVVPIRPDAGSKVLSRPEIVRLSPEVAKARFAEGGEFDARMDMTTRRIPGKLALRSGWNDGDMFMLVEAFARHDPLNPTAILGFERHGSSFAEMISEKEISRENAVRIEDLSGTAQPVAGAAGRGRRPLPTGYAAMTTTVETFVDDPLATLARLRVDNYMGFRAAQTREILFVKNRFVLVRDETAFADRFRARLGPVWNTQQISPRRGATWLDTSFSAHWYNGPLRLYGNPPGAMLLWYAPRPATALSVTAPPDPGVTDDAQQAALRHFRVTRYAWEGDVRPGSNVQFTALLLPHTPVRDAGVFAATIRSLADEPGLSAVAIDGDAGWELVVLNPQGRALDLPAPAGSVSTDARSLYLAIDASGAVRYSASGVSYLRLGTRTLRQGPSRADAHSG